MEEYIKQNLQEIRQRIGEANPDGKKIEIVGVTKTHDVSVIQAALKAGIENIGENKVQEFLDKYEETNLSHPEIKWHMIGHLQRNKVKYVVGKAALIHSLDSIRLAKEINKRGMKEEIAVNTLLQVNVAKEDSKFGLFLEEASSFIKEIEGFKGLKIQGLMTMAPYYDNAEKTRDCFKRLKELFEELKELPQDNIEMKYLSMGMTNDYEVAVEEGSNMVRLGRTLFGKRGS